MTIDEQVAGLQVMLQAEEDLHRRLKALLQREEEELVALDPAELDRTLAEKRALAEEGRLLEESRQVISGELARAVGLPAQGVKLGALIAQLGPAAGDLPAIHGRLSALLASNRTLLDSNERFASRSLAHVRDTLRMLGQAVPEEVGYGPGAARASRTGRGRLVRQAI